MPYRIRLTHALRSSPEQRREQPHGASVSMRACTDQVEVRSAKGLVLFYRPRRVALKL